MNNRQTSPTGAPTCDRDGARLLRLLDLLVLALGRIPPDEALPDTPGGAAPERWEDEEYLYLESALRGTSGSEIDISIREGRALIRIGRQALGPGSGGPVLHVPPDDAPARVIRRPEHPSSMGG